MAIAPCGDFVADRRASRSRCALGDRAKGAGILSAGERADLEGQVIESGAFELMPDNRMAIGTRRGDIYFMSGVDDDKPRPRFDKFAEGLDEIFGLAHRKGEKDTLYVTHSAELTRVRDANGDGRADRFETVSDAWGYRNYHEYAFGSKFDAQGNRTWLGLYAFYHSRALFRGWAMKITPDGKSIPIASGLQPGGDRAE